MTTPTRNDARWMPYCLDDPSPHPVEWCVTHHRKPLIDRQEKPMTMPTPGPWMTDDSRQVYAQTDWMGQRTAFFITDEVCGRTDEEAIANARLIAAAPEMREVLAMLETFSHREDCDSRSHDVSDCAWEQARALLARLENNNG